MKASNSLMVAVLFCSLTLSFLFVNISDLTAQISAEELNEMQYRRSSLHLLLIESEEFPMKDIVIDAYYNTPFPDNYNDHRIDLVSFNPNRYPVTQEERDEFIAEYNEMGDTEPIPEGHDEALIEVIESLEKESPHVAAFMRDMFLGAFDAPIQTMKFFEDKKIANKLVAKWFNRKDDGSFDMNLIGERGHYNASQMDAHIAAGTVRGLASLADAGEQLLQNTFVVVNKLHFISNEVTASVIRDIALKAAERIESEFGRAMAEVAANALYENSKEGYSVYAIAALYQLEWNDSVAAVFYNDYWMSEDNICKERKEKFDNTDLFKLNLIGGQTARGRVVFAAGRSQEEVIETVTIRTIDNVFAKLQKEFDVFKPMVPLLTSNPITAKIGKKEGLTGGETFEVFEQVLNPETGLTEFETVGTIRVNRREIWDNRFNAGEGIDPDEDVDPERDRTTFRGSSRRFHPGMLIRME